jgi:predicted dehydrogenase
VFGDVERPHLAVLCDVTQLQAEQHARAFGFARATADWRALVDDPAVDVVSVTTPNALHAEMAVYALGARQACVVREAHGAGAW